MNQSPFACLRWFRFITLIFLIAGCVGNNSTKNVAPPTQVNPTFSVTSTESVLSNLPATVGSSSPGPDSTKTDTVSPNEWVSIPDWTPANQVRAMLVDQSGNLWAGGPGGFASWNLATGESTVFAIGANPDSTNVVALNQAPDNAILVGTFGNGITKFDGTSRQPFTTKASLPGKYIVSQAIAPNGEIWVAGQKKEYINESGQEFYFGRITDSEWIQEGHESLSWIFALPDGSIIGATDLLHPVTQVGVYNGQTWNDLVYDGQPFNPLRGKPIEAVTVAPDGVIWVATHDTIFRFVNHAWVEIIPVWAGKSFPKVSSIAVSASGVAWFGFSYFSQDLDKCGSRDESIKEQGVYRYDGKTWTHFTVDDGLVDNKICAITVDSRGNAWFGSFDKGISRFDGHNWATYTIR